MKTNEKYIPIVLGIAASFIIGILAYLSFETNLGYWLIFSFEFGNLQIISVKN